MTVSRERFDQGMTYDEYKAQMTRNRETLEANERAVEITDADRRAFSRKVSALVLAEDWCGDVVANLPVLGRLAQDTGNVDIRVFLRDKNLDLMEQYLNQGKFQSIPVFVFFDQANDGWRELGHWIERPASVTEKRREERTKIYASDPRFGAPDAPVDQLSADVRAELQGRLVKMRADTTVWANREVLRELGEIVAR